MERKLFTLVVVFDDTRILLGLKKRGFGEGRWNGFGGKVEDGESIDEAAYRELTEESGLSAKKLTKRGELVFEFREDKKPLEVHVFSADQWGDEPRESDEMKPQWFDLKTIPFSMMWPDDFYWMPLLLQGKNFRGSFFFEDQNIISTYKLDEVNGW